MPVELDQELRFFEEHRAEWLKEHEGQFALIKGNEYYFFESDGQAYTAGLDRWGNVPMLIKQVLPEDPIEGSLALLYGLVDAHE